MTSNYRYMSLLRLLNINFAISILIIIAFSCKNNTPNNQHAPKTAISIAVAANMQFAMEELSQSFTAKTGIPCDMTISSSGKITAQIKEGAPYDIFFSANMKYPEEIFNSGWAAKSPKIYAYGKLVLWTTRQDITPALSQLTDNKIRNIAMANPKIAPYGEAAVAVLQKNGLYKKVEDKLVFGESIAQTNHFITTGAADVGFTALSVVKSPEAAGKGLDNAAGKRLSAHCTRCCTH
ncbi:MAG: molybdate ABC transporter substrate-binding protein [Saprospiraceae bacterium]